MAARGRSQSPVERLDRALLAVRRAPGVLWPAWLGGLSVAAVVMLVYYFERVEGVRELRPVFALALVLAWWIRARLASVSARRAVRALWPSPSLRLEPGDALAVLRLASLVAMGLWAWLWLLVLASFGGPVWVVVVTPLLCLRGATAPGWVAHAGCEPTGGLRGLRAAVSDGAGQRAAGVAVEALVLGGGVLLFFNLFLAAGLIAGLGSSLLGLDVTLVDTFLSPDNLFVWLAVGAVTLVLLEPLRASVSAVFYLEARFRREGLDLSAMVDAATRVPTSTATAGSAARSAAVLALGVLLSSLTARPALAAPDPPPAEATGAPQGAPAASDDARDEDVRARVRGILDQPEFRELESQRSIGLAEMVRRLFERLAKWLDRNELEPPQPAAPKLVPLPSADVFLVLAAVLLAAVVAYVAATRVRDARASRRGRQDEEPTDDPRERAPDAHLDDAAELARQGRHRDALRALYLATLVALDRRGLIRFDPARTNWHYLRHMPSGELREGFARFTRLFDHKWYGDEPTTGSDYADGRVLAERLCAPPEAP